MIPAPDLPKVNITFHSLPGDELTETERLEILNVLLTMNGVVLEPRGTRFLRALPRKTVRTQGIPILIEQNGLLPEDGKVVSQLITFKNVLATEAQKALEGFKDPNGLFQVFERTNAILVTDTQENINRMLEIVKTLDVATPVTEDVFVRQIVYSTAANIKQALEAIVTESQKETQSKESGTKQSGGPGFTSSTRTQSSSGSRLLSSGSQRPGARTDEQQPQETPNADMVAGVSDADRGMIRGKVLILDDERSNKLIVITSKANMDFFDKVISTLDVETSPEVQVEVIRLKYAEAEDVSSMLNDLIGNSSNSSQQNNQNQNTQRGTGSGTLTGQRPGGGQQPPAPPSGNQSKSQSKASSNNQLGQLSKDNIKILADKRINGIVVMARKADMKAIKDVIVDMDVKLSQVLIETCIIEVSLGDEIKTGVDWVQKGKNNSFFNRGSETSGYMLGGGGGTGKATLSELFGTVESTVSNATSAVTSTSEAVSATPIGSGLNYFLKSDRLNLAAVIQASKFDSHAKFLASPIVMTLDNKEAKIEATDMHYILTGFTMSSTSYTSMAVPNYEQKQIGITITVTPKINPNGTVMLTVEEEYSQLGEQQTIQTSGSASDSKLTDVKVDTTVTRKMSADISLENMQTVVLGGLVQSYTSEAETGIPLLKDIPWIGKWLFGSTEKTVARKELLIFMTPYVLNDSESAQAEALRRKKALSDVRSWDDNAWSASPLADPVSRSEQLRKLEEEWKRQDEERRTRMAIEKAKIERLEKLRSMTEDEQSYWLKLHEEELEKETKESEAEQEELKRFVERIRAERLAEAQTQLDEAERQSRETEPLPAPVPEPMSEPLPEETPAPVPQGGVYQKLLRDSER